MNVANMTALATLLDTLPDAKFNMTGWVMWLGGVDMKSTDFHHVGECGTTACIAGWAFHLAHPDTDKKKDILASGVWLDQEANRWLDLSHSEKLWLFYGSWSDTKDPHTNVGLGTPQEAAAAVRAMIAAGGVPDPRDGAAADYPDDDPYLDDFSSDEDDPNF